MNVQTTVKLGKRGTFVVPNKIRQQAGLKEDDLCLVDIDNFGRIIIEPAVALPVETYSNTRKAELLLSSAVDEKDYQEARKEVKKLGLDPDQIEHYRA